MQYPEPASRTSQQFKCPKMLRHNPGNGRALRPGWMFPDTFLTLLLEF